MSFLFGGGSTNTVVQPSPLSQQELDFIKVQTDLAKLQLGNLESLQPFQQALVQDALRNLGGSQEYNAALDKLISPEDRAKAEAEQFRLAEKFGPMQAEVLRMQLQNLRQGGRATPEQMRDIRRATNTAIESGSYDIDRSTETGIGMIADELANSRGLRLTDTPILREATLLADEGAERKASLIKSMRANQSNAILNYPLAVQGLQGQMGLQTAGLLQSAGQFQADLRQRAFQNRMALTGQASNTGLGMSSINGALPAIPHGSTSSGSVPTNWGATLGGVGALMAGGAALYPFVSGLSGAAGGAAAAGAAGGAALAMSDARVKHNYGVVAKTRGGLPLHVFHYKGEPKDAPLRLGVMAQETERLFPEAVTEDERGIKLVDYRKVA